MPVAQPLDPLTTRKIARGKLVIEARIDLHGMTQDEAHGLLLSFLARAAQRHLRTVLVITGKGRLGVGILRARLFDWIGALETWREKGQTPASILGRVRMSYPRMLRILVPLDFSGKSRQALRYAIPIAQKFSARIFLVHVLPPFGNAPKDEQNRQRLAALKA
ncbi:MAG: universal stress protein [Phyllobacteriaceae bacterium]|nr:universal stress protein [Phyllobacteriaceae bacterium]